MPSPSRASITQLAGTLLAGYMRLDSTAIHRERKIDVVRDWGGSAMSVITQALDAAKRIAGAIGNLLPAPPSAGAPPPDIDGKRQGELDPESLRRVELARKVGKGGYR